MKRAIQLGAGNIGRGFLGQLFYQSGYETVFVEIRDEIVKLLTKRGEYKLELIGERSKILTISNVRAVDVRDTEQVVQEFIDADIGATAVGNSALPAIAPLIAKGMDARRNRGIEKPLNIIICENLLNASDILRNYVLSHTGSASKDYIIKKLGLVESVVSRMVPVLSEETTRKDPLYIKAEEYAILPVDKLAFKGGIPEIVGMIPRENIKAYERQKLYTHNAGHAIAAYLGYLKGHNYIWESMEDREVQSIVRGALEETGKALIEQEKFSEEEHWGHVQDLLKRFSNKELGDTVFRVARDPLRKLAPTERLVGSAKLAMRYNFEPVNVCKGIASALKYNWHEDREAQQLQTYLKERGADWVLKNICRLDIDGKIAKLIKGFFDSS
ncbi:MAG TPA: mannitol-1-phosphate 5-dehydrogenase [Candidatus Omnitrophica bacterium]|nr:mannitol-1-phosphate 5-dehydrogenase [Candidatus Omnitrophota bacterium]